MQENKHYTIIDLETTGGDPRRDRITEIAVFRYDGDQVVDSFVSLVNPDMAIPAYISRLTGINNEMVADAPRFYEVAKRIVEITEGAIFVAHNVRFDYSFLQKEFRLLGYPFSKKQLCTIKLSKKMLPEAKSYKLQALCKYVGIETHNWHRAGEDAQATLLLFQHLLKLNESSSISITLRQELAISKLPPNLSSDMLDKLPPETGIYYFHGSQGEVIYVGKSTNIRKRVLSHFQNAHKQKRSMRMLEQIHDISFELTGSELIALLRENEEIKSIQPAFNRAQKKKTFRYAICSHLNKQGYRCLSVERLYSTMEHEVVAPYPTRSQADASLRNVMEALHLCPKYCGLERGSGRCFHSHLHKCLGACVEEEAVDPYNDRVYEAIISLNHGVEPESNFLVLSEGRDEQEVAVVCVSAGKYQGYAYLDQDILTQHPSEVQAYVNPRDETPDVQKILRGYIRKYPNKVLKW